MTVRNMVAGTVLVGVDGSDPTMRAVRWAAAEAALRRVPLRVVSTFDLESMDGQDVGLGDILMDNVPALVMTAVAHARQVAPDLVVTGEVLVEQAIPWLVAMSGQAGLVVLGVRGQSGIAGMRVGPVVMALAAQSACPLVLVRGPELDAAAPSDGTVVVGTGELPDSDRALAYAFEAAAARR